MQLTKAFPILIALFFPLHDLMAQEPQAQPENAQNTEQPTTQTGAIAIQINQPYVSKTLGNLTLPFMWEAEEIESQKRIIAIESRSNKPAILTIDFIETPKYLKDDVLAQSIASSVAEALGAQATVTSESIKSECGKSKCPSITIFRSNFKGIEKNVQRRCAVEIVPSSGKTLVFTICAEASQIYDPDLPEILNQVLGGMK